MRLATGSFSLLHNVGQLVRQQFLPLGAFGPILPLPEEYVPSCGEGSCIHCTRQFGSLRVRMHSNLAKVIPEARLEENTFRPG